MIEVIKYRDLVEIKSIPRFVHGMPSLTLELIGDNFTSVEEVLVNELTCQEYVVVDKKTLWAVLPPGAQDKISTVEVISGDFTKTAAASKIQYKFGAVTKRISGLLRLVQLFVKIMLQTPGSDIFNMELGGGLQELVGRIMTTRKMEPVMASIIQSISRTTSQIRTIQMRTRGRMSADERLMSADLVDFGIHEDRMEAVARVKIQAASGKVAVSNLSL